MLKKQIIKSRQVVKVTFEVPQAELPEGMAVTDIHVVGEFNGWDETAVPLTYHKKEQTYRATVELEPDQTYQFRYLINGSYWCNDWAADEYTPNSLGEDNCVVVIPALENEVNPS
ncbi:MAG: isoamylase early set domain-containing protein [Candidatus Promineifilaceae bacterium]|jgi:1,4-alpha-glucan branching enzyme